MGVLAAGNRPPSSPSPPAAGDRFTREHLHGKRTLLVFYPFAFSPVCTGQLGVYQEVLEDFADAA